MIRAESAMNGIRRRRSFGIQARLVALILVTVLPLVALSTFAILRTVNDERSQIERDVRERAENLLADVNREIRSVQVSLEILASSPNLQHGDMEAFGNQIREALNVQGLAIGLHDTIAQELVSTTRPYRELPVRQTNRGAVERVVRTGKPHISNLFTGMVLQRPILTVGVPVFRHSEVVYVLTMALDPARLSGVLREQNLPSEWTAEIFDRKGIVVARNRDLDRFFGQPAAPMLQEPMSKAAAGWFPSVTSEGLRAYSAFLRSPVTDWTVAITVPKDAIDGPLRHAYQLALCAGAGVLCLSLSLAWWMARAIRRPMAALTAAARAMGSGAHPSPSAGGVREIEEVSDALRASAEELEERARARTAAEAALRASEERFRMLAEALPQLVWSCVPDGRVDYLSQQWLDYTGMSDAEPLDSQRLKQVIHPDDLAATTACWAAAAEGRADYDLEHRIRAADGSYRWFKTRGTAVRHETGWIIKWFGTCTDIQEIVETREMLARSRLQLETMVVERTRELAAANEQLIAEIRAREQAQAALLQAQKMEAMGQLTGGIAHDFNNLLTVACGSLELLEARISDEKSRRLLQSAQSAMSRGAKLTGSLLAFARKQRLEPAPADINSIVIEVTDLLGRSIGDTVEIRHALASEPWPILIDISQIETALLNVATNARDAMPTGGVLLIETTNIPNGHDDVPDEVVGQDCVLVALTDTGTGMSPEVIDHAFEPFFTTKDIGKGTGLGLSTVFGIVRQSGGAVRIRSRVGQGTTVQIYLPRANCRSIASPEEARPVLARTNAGARILVVDDDPAVRWVTVECLREIGHFVAEADGGAAALKILQRGDPCDLLVMDVVMPGLSGTDTVRLARQTRPDLKVLYVTGYADRSAFIGKVSGDLLIMKPFKPAILAETIRNALRRVPQSEVGNVVPLRRGGEAVQHGC
jgi:PAS domain S-box-containing protein